MHRLVELVLVQIQHSLLTLLSVCSAITGLLDRSSSHPPEANVGTTAPGNRLPGADALPSSRTTS